PAGRATNPLNQVMCMNRRPGSPTTQSRLSAGVQFSWRKVGGGAGCRHPAHGRQAKKRTARRLLWHDGSANRGWVIERPRAGNGLSSSASSIHTSPTRLLAC
ncbi:unnamed protein product, partial [Phaeothamnion confervicola]